MTARELRPEFPFAALADVSGVATFSGSEPSPSLAWNDTAADYPHERCLHQLFEQQVQRTPHAVALVHQDQQLTYAQLNDRANQLAHCLQSQGVKPDTLVAVCINRSLDMVVALLGVLKAGGAYVALDPAYPAQRIQYTLNDAQTTLLITQEALLDTLPQTQARIVCLDRDREHLHAWPTHNPVSEVAPDSLVYVLYTSGSTGLPKGVAIEHHSPVALVSWALAELSSEELSGVVFATSICFDLSVYELFVTLCGGGRVLLVENALAIAQLASEAKPTLINTVPSAMAELLRMGAVPSTVCRVNLAGEPLSGSLVDGIYAQTGVSKVYDLYGPSEDTTYSTCALRERGGPVTIGCPISNTRAYVLDGWGHPVPVGVAGELHLGGAGLARGYLNRPELTAEKFVPDPFSRQPGERLYRTGDLVRYLPDGNLAFVGRIDHQVKIRGFRIELGEIESVLLQHSGIQEAVVLAREDVPGDRWLVGYLVAPDQDALIDLHSFLRVRLPDYMVPGAFVRLDALPLTSNGKVDRRALPAPEGRGAAVTSDLIAPETPTQRWLVEAWQAELRVAPIGIRDSFFEIGGHSLMAVRIFDRIQKERDRSLSPATLFQAPTIEALAAILDQEDWKPDWKCLVAIRPNGTRPPFFLIHGALAHVLFARVLVQYLPEEIPIFGIQSLGLDGKARPLTRVEEMAELYVREIQSVQPSGPYYLGGLSFGGVIALEVAQRLRARGHELGLLVMLNSDCPVPSPHFPKRSFLFERKLIPWMLHAEDAAIALRKHGLRRFLSRKFARARRKAGQPVDPDANEEQIEAAAAANDVRMKIFKVNRAAERAYRPRSYPGRITLFYATERHPLQYVETDTRLAWSDFAEGGLEIHLVPGDHVSMRQEPHAKILTAKLTACLDRAYAVKQ